MPALPLLRRTVVGSLLALYVTAGTPLAQTRAEVGHAVGLWWQQLHREVVQRFCG